MAWPDFYPTDYLTARRRLRDAAGRFGWHTESHPIAARGPGGGELALDVFTSPRPAPATLILSSGVHGVEGPFGSAVQLFALNSWGNSPPVRVVLVHAVNPFGFAHRRRFNEDNVDLNRNFLLPDQRYTGSPPRYADLDPLLNPPVPPARLDPFPLHAAWKVLKHGLPALKQAIAGGQYDHPRGIFFGGHRPAESVQICGEQLRHWLGESGSVFHLDFHTGLGPWGSFKLLLDIEPTADQRQWLTDRFGVGSFEVSEQNGVAYETVGGFGPWCAARRGDREYLFACAEFGTYGPITVLTAVKRENQAHHWGTAGSAATERAKRRLAEVFVPASAAWRSRALEQAWELVDSAARGLASRAT